MNYRIDGRCEISNNRAEQESKSYAVGTESLPVPYIRSWSWGRCGNVQHCGETAKANNLGIFSNISICVLLYMPDL